MSDVCCASFSPGSGAHRHLPTAAVGFREGIGRDGAESLVAAPDFQGVDSGVYSALLWYRSSFEGVGGWGGLGRFEGGGGPK